MMTHQPPQRQHPNPPPGNRFQIQVLPAPAHQRTPRDVAAGIYLTARRQKIADLQQRISMLDAQLDAEIIAANQELAQVLAEMSEDTAGTLAWRRVYLAACDVHDDRINHAAAKAAERRQQLKSAITALDYPAKAGA